ncbi:MAG: phage protein Gp36 family protein [Dehalococcoidia bacterium]|jgi:phage gp36-like protein
MANYTTIALLQNRVRPENLAQMADDVTTTPITTTAQATASLALAGTIANMNQAITDASRLIDSWLLGHVDMADADTLNAVEFHCASIALYNLATRRFMNDENNPWAGSYKNAMAWLKGQARGELHVQTNPDSPSTMVTYSKSSTDRTITSTELSNYV